MKKLLLILTACTALLCLAACNGNDIPSDETAPPSQSILATPGVAETDEAPSVSVTPEQDTPVDTQSPPEEDAVNVLVVYFSATGNTRFVAETLAEIQDADLYEIVPEQPYTDADLNYNNRSSRSTVEQNDENARPAILGGIDNIEDYDVIYIGYPIWWGDMPRILYTFFDAYDLSGKTIAPFCTSGGSGLSGTPRAISRLEPNSVILDGLHISDSSLSNAESNLTEWISSIGLAKEE